MKKSIIIFTIIALLSSGVYVTKVEASSISITESSDVGITLYADVIQYVYRENNGRLQYRRWNRTWACWVDPYWIYA